MHIIIHSELWGETEETTKLSDVQEGDVLWARKSAKASLQSVRAASQYIRDKKQGEKHEARAARESLTQLSSCLPPSHLLTTPRYLHHFPKSPAYLPHWNQFNPHFLFNAFPGYASLTSAVHSRLSWQLWRHILTLPVDLACSGMGGVWRPSWAM